MRFARTGFGGDRDGCPGVAALVAAVVIALASPSAAEPAEHAARAGDPVAAPQQAPQQQAAPQGSEQEPQQGAQQQQQEQQTPPQEPPQEPMSAEEEAALRLVEQILREEEGVLMGRDLTYDASGRRDPFRSLLLSLQAVAAPTTRPPGLPGFLINEVELKAIANAQGRWYCLLLGPDQRTYAATVGTELFDGHIVEIRQGEVVFEQQVADLTGTRRTRPVVKQLRTIGGN